MSFCINCGHQLTDGAKFCAECGTAVCASTGAMHRKTVFEGELHKCPQCGEVLNSFSVNCPTCGYELRGTKGASSVRELTMKLQQIQSTSVPTKMNIESIFTQALSGGQLSTADEKKVELIKGFSIPNTKEDVMEFFILASSNIDIKLYGMEYDSSQLQGKMAASQKAVSDAWLAKLEQAYQKAQLMWGGTPEFSNIQAIYDRKMREIRMRKWLFPAMIFGAFVGIFLIIGFAMLIFGM